MDRSIKNFFYVCPSDCECDCDKNRSWINVEKLFDQVKLSDQNHQNGIRNESEVSLSLVTKTRFDTNQLTRSHISKRFLNENCFMLEAILNQSAYNLNADRTRVKQVANRPPIFSLQRRLQPQSLSEAYKEKDGSIICFYSSTSFTIITKTWHSLNIF